MRRRALAPAIRASIAVHALAPLGAVLDISLLPWIAGGLVANHTLLAAAGMWPRSRVLGPNMTRLPLEAGARGEVALTFDDGPDPLVTPQVLDLLDGHGATASFFCIGAAAKAAPALARQIVARGHSVENHTMTHSSAFACLGPRGLRREVAGAQSELSDITGTAPRFFRAPMGLRSPLLDPVLAENRPAVHLMDEACARRRAMRAQSRNRPAANRASARRCAAHA